MSSFSAFSLEVSEMNCLQMTPLPKGGGNLRTGVPPQGNQRQSPGRGKPFRQSLNEGNLTKSAASLHG
jgi:hypothetical protein